MNDVIWAVQSNLVSNNNDHTVDAIRKAGLRMIPVMVIPFSDTYELWEQPEHDRVIPYGSTTFIKNANKQNKDWKGLYFNEDKMRSSEWVKHRQDMLNQEAVLTTFGQARDLMENGRAYFIRPDSDLKTFSGEVTNREQFVEWSDKIIGKGYTFGEDLPVVLAPAQEIKSEARFFVVGGAVIDGSIYRADGKPHRQHIDEHNPFFGLAQDLADKWLPDLCVCMDVAMVQEVYRSEGCTSASTKLSFKVIEFNCINASGWYDHNVSEVVQAFTSYVGNQ